MPQRKGRILLNGACSSGKSTIGGALLALLPDPWFLVPVDEIGAMLGDAEISQMLNRIRLGYHRAVAASASVGNDVIMYSPLSQPWRGGGPVADAGGVRRHTRRGPLRPG